MAAVKKKKKKTKRNLYYIMHYNSTPNPFAKYLKERMKKKKSRERDRTCSVVHAERERERERSEGQKGVSTATELANLTLAREVGSDRGRVG